MAPGEMLHAPSFSLFEAMSAIEIGDPRMDASLAALTSPTAKDLVESGNVPTQLDASTLLSVLDKQMIMDMTWQQGHSLAQTVFTCAYMLRPDRHASPSPHASTCMDVFSDACMMAVACSVLRQEVCCAQDLHVACSCGVLQGHICHMRAGQGVCNVSRHLPGLSHFTRIHLLWLFLSIRNACACKIEMIRQI